MRRFLLAALVAAACMPQEPGIGLFAPSVEKCKTKGCKWIDAKAKRLATCKAMKPADVIRGAECMRQFIVYYGTTPCKNTRAWLARLKAGIPEDE